MTATIALAGSMRRDLHELVDILLSTPNTEQRSIGVGLLDPQVARDFSNVGPMVRGSGHRRDMRQDHPYAGYARLPFEICSETGNDVYSRLKVRIHEVFNSLNMIEFGLQSLPGGPLAVEGFNYIPHRFALGFAEAPRGDDIHWSMTGDNQKLFRWRCRAATYANWPGARRLHWNRLLPARAIENLCYVAAVNRVGTDGKGFAYTGDSQVLDFQGETLLSAGEADGVFQVCLDAAELAAYRTRFPANLDADTFQFV